MSATPIRTKRAALFIAAVLTLATIPAVVSAPPAASAPQTWQFDYVGYPEHWTVPDGVHELTMIVVGASGGDAGTMSVGPGVSSTVVGTLDVTPGQELTIWVGGQGGQGGANGGSPAARGGWGFGCGGRGGVASNFLAGNGAGGGGASAVTVKWDEVGELDCSSPRPLSDQVFAVAGGSGGGGGDVVVPPGTDALGSQIEFGGIGGDAGPTPTAGGGGSDGTANGGCGGCSGSVHGQQGSDDPGGAESGAGGGGGGGWIGGDGGFVANAFFGGGGGGGASSIAGGSLRDVGFIAGTSSGNGSVTLTAGESQLFNCTGSVQHTTVPSGAGWMAVDAQGGHGGTRGENKGAPGGKGGLAAGTVEVVSGQAVDVYVGCAGTRDPGWGYGTGGRGGDAPDPWPYDGAGGGGSSAVVTGGNVVVVAAGGGGGGGQGGAFGIDGGGNPGGEGGHGGNPPTAGAQGLQHDYAGGKGGCAACVDSLNGGSGGSSGRASEGGGGGGGGAGWCGGAGGREGKLDLTLVGGGGGGGGAGLNRIFSAAIDVTNGESSLGGNGIVDLVFSPNTPTLISSYSGAGQAAIIGGTFAQPLVALVTDASGYPVPGVTVTFTLPGTGASGTFAGGGTTANVTTSDKGLATSPLITANHVGGVWGATASVSGIATPAIFPLKNLPVRTSTHLTASANPATPTEEVTFTATVAAATSSAGTPTGQVKFKVDGTDLGGPVDLVDGTATSQGTELAVGHHEITAEYLGAPGYLESRATLPLTVEKTPTATHVASTANPSDVGQEISFTATITVPPGNTPYSGTVQFLIDGASFGAPVAATNGEATSQTTDSLTLGPHTIEAVAAETDDYLGSTGRLTQQVDPDGTATKVSTPTNPIEYGVPIELDALVSPGANVVLVPSGSVELKIDGSPEALCTGTLEPVPDTTDAETSCEVPSPLAPSTYDIVGDYLPNSPDFDPSTGTLVLQVTKAKTATTMTASPPGPSTYGQPVTFTASVARAIPGAGTPTGTVQFQLDGQDVGAPVPLSSGQATSPPVTPDAGVQVVTAIYSGDTNFAASSGADAYAVEPASTTTTVTAMPEPSQEGEPVTFAADVTAQVPGATVVPTGWVQFHVDGVAYGDPVELVDGHAVAPTRDDLDHGIHHIAARYVPDTKNFLPSHATIEHDVREPSTTVVAASENPAAVGSPLTLKAHVGPAANAGTIDFLLDGVPIEGCLGVPVHESEAACTFVPRSASEHVAQASFSGAPTLDPSSGTLVLELLADSRLRPTFTG